MHGPVWDWASVALGLTILLLAGDALVKGAVNLSLRLGVPALIVSLTIVAFGTSAPELLIAIQSVLEDVSELALGNVVGSNTANVLFVLGIPALFASLDTAKCDTKKSYLQMIAGTALFIAVCFIAPKTGEDHQIVWWLGLVLLAALAAVLFSAFLQTKSHMSACADDEEDVEGADPSLPGWKIGLFLLLGIVGLPIGADLLVDGATEIARDFRVDEEIIGLTLVAIGTSLPELATTVVAALRRQADVALGNVIGSNMFNLLAIIGVASLVGPIDVSDKILSFDIWIMLASSLLLIPFVFFKMNITRAWGGVLTALYVAYVIVVIT